MYSMGSMTLSETASVDSLASDSTGAIGATERLGPTPLITALLHNRDDIVRDSKR